MAGILSSAFQPHCEQRSYGVTCAWLPVAGSDRGKHTSARDAAYVNFDLLHLQMLLLEADWLVLPGGKLEKGPVWVSVEGQKITGVFKDRAPPTTDYTIHHAHLIAPGFVDIHTHGVGESSG